MAAQPAFDLDSACRRYAATTQAEPARILVADDQADVVYALCLLLKGAGYETVTADGPAQVVAALEQKGAELVLMDMNYSRDTTSGGEGLDLIDRIRKFEPDMPILAMTAWGSIDLAVDAMRRGAADFVQKPWDSPQLLEKVGSLVHLQRNTAKVRKEEAVEQGDAIELQRRLLAFEAPESKDCEISGMSRSLRFVGGDYCKVDRIADRRFAVSIADVAGKGVPGAMLGASLRAAQKPMLAEGVEPAHLCATLNQAMAEITPHGKFISFFFGVLDLERKLLTYCNAGHNPPLVIAKSGDVSTLAAGGAVLGYFPEWRYEQATIPVHSGDRIGLFTDGIIEAWSAEKGEFGTDGLAQLASELRGHSAAELQDALLAKVSEHCGGTFNDDCTLVVIAIP